MDTKQSFWAEGIHLAKNRPVMTRSPEFHKRNFLFHPLLVLTICLAGPVLYALYSLRPPTAHSQAWQLSDSFFYVAPIIVPFVAFLFDRIERLPQLNWLQLGMDGCVVALAMGRVVANVPFISGHTLFLTYAIFSSRSIVVRVTAVLVMAQTLYLKYFVWHDFVTSTCGILLGTVLAIVVYRWGQWTNSKDVVQ